MSTNATTFSVWVNATYVRANGNSPGLGSYSVYIGRPEGPSYTKTQDWSPMLPNDRAYHATISNPAGGPWEVVLCPNGPVVNMIWTVHVIERGRGPPMQTFHVTPSTS